MSNRSDIAALRASSVLSLAACIVSVLMLLAFPVQSGHQYGSHLRTPEVRASIERHTFVAYPEAENADRIANQAVMLAVVTPIETSDAITLVASPDLFPQVPIARLLARLKLGPSRSGGQDPLL